MNESYVRGFMSKCAEYGVPEDAAVALLKAAQMYQQPTTAPRNPDSYAKTAPEVTTLPYKPGTEYKPATGIQSFFKKNPKLKSYFDSISKNVNAITNMQNVVTR